MVMANVPKNYKTKSQYMRYKAKSRTSTYFNEAKDTLLPKGSDDNAEMIKKKERVIEEFRSKLEKNSYYDKRFDRTADGNQKLCDEFGKFDCQGASDKDSCHDHHHINPYLRKEDLANFENWNLARQ
ncbi:hypothetical protein BSL78_09641 [Apostichopus japonicus]|uniref:DNA fragmentation factor 40 C-terminal domain-containing protein n=1 Tax=Stichopus japonicus TaxID=307972 RepID=A0A2G8KZR7_STIJA|nr:hypothetical protein BSL78_09641 [Apostichopus japonicus]